MVVRLSGRRQAGNERKSVVNVVTCVCVSATRGYADNVRPRKATAAIESEVTYIICINTHVQTCIISNN